MPARMPALPSGIMRAYSVGRLVQSIGKYNRKAEPEQGQSSRYCPVAKRDIAVLNALAVMAWQQPLSVNSRTVLRKHGTICGGSIRI